MNFKLFDVTKKFDFLLIVLYQEIAAFGARTIESYLKGENYQVATVYFKTRRQEQTYPSTLEFDLLNEFIKHSKPTIIGFSVMSPFYSIAKILTEMIKKNFSIPTIWGGIHPTICPEECIEIADICCVGDGEEPIRMIIDSMKRRKSYFNTPNCWFRNNNGMIIKNQMEYICQDLDTLPYPDFSNEGKYLIDDNRILAGDPYVKYIKKNHIYDFKAYRGCPFSCSYCNNTAIRDAYCRWGTDSYMRKRSVDHVIGELKEAKIFFPHLKRIRSYDEIFFSDTQYVREFSEKYKKEIGLPLSCDGHVNMVNDNIIKMLSFAGLESVSVGIEAFSEYVRKSIYKRNMSNRTIIEKAKILNRHDIRVSYDFIYDNPMESEKDLKTCFWDLIIHLPRPCRFNNYSLSHLPKSDLTFQFLMEGKIKEKDIVGNSDKAITQWKVTAKKKRDISILFWHSMFSIYAFSIHIGTKEHVVPIFIIKFLAKTKNYTIARNFFRFITLVKWAANGVLIKNLFRNKQTC